MNFMFSTSERLIRIFATMLCFTAMLSSQTTARLDDGVGSSRQIFEEVAESTGLKFQHYNGMTGKMFLPEIMGAGAALFDFDNDGDLDVFIVQGSVLEPGARPAQTLFPWREPGEPRGKLFRNDLAV